MQFYCIFNYIYVTRNHGFFRYNMITWKLKFRLDKIGNVLIYIIYSNIKLIAFLVPKINGVRPSAWAYQYNTYTTHKLSWNNQQYIEYTVFQQLLRYCGKELAAGTLNLEVSYIWHVYNTYKTTLRIIFHLDIWTNSGCILDYYTSW